jgi:hypothetical protein
LQLKFEFLINNIVRTSLNMNNKGRALIGALIAVVILSAFGVALVITTTPDVALAQDQNPPTTGKTTPNVTSTFGPNLPTTTSSSASNTTSDKVGNMTK